MPKHHEKKNHIGGNGAALTGEPSDLLEKFSLSAEDKRYCLNQLINEGPVIADQAKPSGNVVGAALSGYLVMKYRLHGVVILSAFFGLLFIFSVLLTGAGHLPFSVDPPAKANTIANKKS